MKKISNVIGVVCYVLVLGIYGAGSVTVGSMLIKAVKKG